MVRTLVIVSAVFALFATVSAGPLVNVKTNKHIGTGKITLNNIGNRLVSADNLKVHDIAQRIKVLKRAEEVDSPGAIRISKAFGVKGNKMMAKPKGAKGDAPK